MRRLALLLRPSRDFDTRAPGELGQLVQMLLYQPARLARQAQADQDSATLAR
jgi:hypothetical protein